MSRQRGSKWQADVKINGLRVRPQFDTKEEADAFEEKAKGNITTTVNKRTIQTIFDEGYTLFWKGTKDDRNCLRIKDELAAFFGPDRDINTITNQSITQFILDQKNKGNKETTIDRKLMRLNMLLRHAVSQGDFNGPAPVAPVFNADNPRERFLTDKEVDDLLGRLRQRKHYDFCVFLLNTGCRVGEGLGLEWRSVTDSSVSFYQTKNGRPRTIPLTSEAKAVLEQRRGLQRPFSDIDYRTFSKDWVDAKNQTTMRGDEDVVPHILRHTLASRLAQSGIDLYRIKTWLGHSNIKTTERYAHLIPSSLDGALVALERN